MSSLQASRAGISTSMCTAPITRRARSGDSSNPDLPRWRLLGRRRLALASQQCRELLWVQRLAVEVTLRHVAAALAEEFGLRRGLDTFGKHVQVQTVGE